MRRHVCRLSRPAIPVGCSVRRQVKPFVGALSTDSVGGALFISTDYILLKTCRIFLDYYIRIDCTR